MSIFTCQSERYCDALRTFDPMSGEWLLGIIDPITAENQDGKPKWIRIWIFGLILCIPLCVFSLIPSPLFCYRPPPPHEKGAFWFDLGIYSVFIFLIASLYLIPKTRRVLGDLLNEVVLRGLAEPSLRNFTPLSAPKGKLLAFFESISRVGGHFWGYFWYWVCFAASAFGYCILLISKKNSWQASPIIEAGSLFYLPNLAGLWSLLVICPLLGYLVVLMARLMIIFACQCAELAKNETLKIIPFHPDGAGGLLPIGQVAFLFAIFMFFLGIVIVGTTANEFVEPSTGSSLNINQINQFILCVIYIVFGSLFFFLALTPLRAKMAKAKRDYLIYLNDLYIFAEPRFQNELKERFIDTDSQKNLEYINALFNSVSSMADWPFDRKLILKYSGLNISLPIIGKLLSKFVELYWAHPSK